MFTICKYLIQMYILFAANVIDIHTSYICGNPMNQYSKHDNE